MFPGEESARTFASNRGCWEPQGNQNTISPFFPGGFTKSKKTGRGEGDSSMAKPTVTIVDHAAGVRLVKFEIPGGVTTPAEAAEAVEEIETQLVGDKPVLIWGRGPVWIFAMIAHAAHPTPMVATFDPRLGYVVVATHNEKYKVGETIDDPEAE